MDATSGTLEGEEMRHKQEDMTHLEQETLKEIQRFAIENGYYPSDIDVSKMTNTLTQTAGARKRSLIEKGMLTRIDHCRYYSETLGIVKNGHYYCDEQGTARETLDVIHNFAIAHGYYPTNQEIAKEMQLTTRAIEDRKATLLKKGWLVYIDHCRYYSPGLKIVLNEEKQTVEDIKRKRFERWDLNLFARRAREEHLTYGQLQARETLERMKKNG